MSEDKNQGQVWSSPNVRLDQPSVARMYDYFLGGYHNFEIDRKATEQFASLFPDLFLTARVNRAFLRRAAAYVARQGVDQFLDLGSGIPTVGNVHEIVRQYNPEARTVYVDVDPVAIAHSEAILEGDSGAGAVLSDIRQVDYILEHKLTKKLIDFSRPVGLFAVAVLHYIIDDAEANQVIERFKAVLPSGSYVTIGVWTYDDAPREVMAKYAELTKTLSTPGAPRPRAKVLEYFEGLEMVEPGLVHSPQWRPDGPDDLSYDEPERSVTWVGVGRKP